MPPAYFYHLAFELYHQHSKHSEQLYLPTTATDLFKDDFPAHRTYALDSRSPKRPGHRRTKTDIPANSGPDIQRSSSFDRSSEDRKPIRDLATTFPKNPPTSHPHTIPVKDWRLEAITIDSINMEDRIVQERRPATKKAAAESEGELITRATFYPSDPKSTDVGWGVVHLYRDTEETPRLYDEGYIPTGDTTFNEEECTTLCILAVPFYMAPYDLLGWAGPQVQDDISHFRFVRSGMADYYMALMKFREAKKANAWRKEYNGRSYNFMEPQTAHVVFVRSITFQTGDNMQKPLSFPNMSNDPFIPESQPSIKAAAPTSPESSLTIGPVTQPETPSSSNLVELPTCPVCLERMDETTGLMTILCQHVFHCNCLEKWKGSACPVCRYTQVRSYPGRGILGSPHSAGGSGNACTTCGAEQNLWICLVCGNVGCGRYDSAHAYAHYESTSHCYAMDIATQHVWDYAGDGYVHRLIQNKDELKPRAPGSEPIDSKAVDGGMAAFGADMVPREKMEAMGNEYAYLLQSQLGNQRIYYEDTLARANDKANKACTAADKVTAALDAVTQKLSDMQTQHSEALANIKDLEKNLDRTIKKADKTNALAQKLAKDWQAEKTMNEALSQKITFLDGKLKESEKKHAELQAEKAELEDQNRDLIFTITGGEKFKELKEAGEDVDGQIEIGTKGKKGKGRKK